jgi:hypothetical protein
MSDPIPQAVSLIPRPPELRFRLAVALREVDLLRRLIRVSEHAARSGCPAEPTDVEEARRAS